MKRLLLALVLLVSCRTDAIDAMARTTKLVDEQYSVLMEIHADACLDESGSWEEYDSCLRPWLSGADAVTSLRNVTLSLDADHGLRAFRSSACRWHDALEVVDATSPSPLPAVKAALSSKYGRRC